MPPQTPASKKERIPKDLQMYRAELLDIERETSIAIIAVGLPDAINHNNEIIAQMLAVQQERNDILKELVNKIQWPLLLSPMFC
ncbi:hypothetical protein Trydic_g21320 [Trypoxylus dichotomus]